jgi:hypothetical protein
LKLPLGARDARFFQNADRHHALARFFQATSTRKEKEAINMKYQPKKTLTYNPRFIVTVRIKKVKRIEQLMNDKDKERTGLTKLTPKELANLNAWLDTDRFVPPGHLFT